ncbi:MAG: macrocin O-methyltransferase [Deltaproteobacteria bacterium]|nr:MAG: macrocin O-methyltransferase [Deltaproteobacteria bacterium]TMQ26940.1 MAG: macrocin O-methyltransferase [Deltaproteobacteria bacterium]
MPPTAADLYLDLLKKVLTGTLAGREPDVDDPAYVEGFLAHYIRGHALTMTPLVRLDNARHCVEQALAHGVPGDLLEAGVWRGGMTIFLRAILAAHRVTDRRVWVADSFEGLPAPDAKKFPLEARAHASRTMAEDFQHFAVSEADVRASFAAFGLLDDQVRFLVGWFKDTLPAAPIDRLAVLRLDGDYYESTMDTLTALYDKVSPGGFVIIDDYGERLWTYCRRAVDDFRRARSITAELIKVDTKCYFWQKPA